MPFNQVLDQKKALDILKNSIRKKSLAHSYLFHGPDGVGKKLAA